MPARVPLYPLAMNKTPAQIRKQITAARKVAEATRLALCLASRKCEETTRAWPQAAIDEANASYVAALAARTSALEKLNSLLS